MSAGGEKKGAVRTALVNGLAIFGVIALLVGGILLIVNGARALPNILGGNGAAGVYTSSVFRDENGNVVPQENFSANENTATETGAQGNPRNQSGENEQAPETGGDTPTQNTSTNGGEGLGTPNFFSPNLPQAPSVAGNQTTPTRGTTGTQTTRVQTTRIVPVVTSTLSGLPDLSVEIISVGYLTSASASSYRVSSVVPEEERGGVRFLVRNVGTNVSGPWRFMLSMPTSPRTTFESSNQRSLNPGASIEFTLGFDNPDSGNDRQIEVVVDEMNIVRESNENNNVASRTIDVDGRNSSSRNNDVSCELFADDTSIREGERVRLTWDVGRDVTSASINEGIGSVDEDGGSETVRPREDTTYRMTVRGDGETDTCSVRVRVN